MAAQAATSTTAPIEKSPYGLRYPSVPLLLPALTDFHPSQLGGINQITFFAAVTLVKISMCLFNRRLTSLTSKPWLIINNTFLGILVVWFFISFFVNVFQCQPVTGFFNYSIQVHTSKYHCMDKAKISNSFSIINCGRCSYVQGADVGRG